MLTGPVLCRGCSAPLSTTLADLGRTPLANGLVSRDKLEGVARYPLRVVVCDRCRLVQLDRDLPPASMFSDYLYFSSYSASWLAHARTYCEAMISRLGLEARSRVVEIASNDGYLLKNFVARGIPCLGIEPAANVAAVAVASGVPTLVDWFTKDLAERLRRDFGPADLIVANNVFAHVPDIHGFVAGIARLLASGGVWTVEFPHVLRLLAETQFDTIYHEHVFYFSMLALEPIFARHGLVVSDVDELPTHGGSLRLHVRHSGSAADISAAVHAVRAAESAAGLGDGSAYAGFQDRIERVCEGLRRFLSQARAKHRRVAAYGAAAKGATLLDTAGITTSDILYVCDGNPHKQGLFFPGSGLEVVSPERIATDRPDDVLVLPWNLADEIGRQLGSIVEWKGRLVRAIPALSVWEPPR
ncbi:MAG: class I SAM-dependent methyltransferase [Rhodospirillales bacterium]|nr:class I SAM-dependent methyltransferase [Rhodospirillales bacterium]